MSPSSVLASVRDYYTGRLLSHGPTPRGADWNSAESQQLRFEQLLRVCDRAEQPFVLGDYGCGYGALLSFLRQRGFAGSFRGYDVSPAMVAEARRQHPDCAADFDTDEAILHGADYVVASGVLNVKLATPVAEWEAYALGVLDRLADLGRRGFAFNALTRYSDPERMRPDLYYADPCRLFDRCKTRYARNVALLHDYGLYEFTILVRR